MNSLFEWAPAEALPVGMRGAVALLEFAALEKEPEDAAAEEEDVAAREAGERALQVRVMVDAAREAAAAETRESMRAEMEAVREDALARLRAVEAAFAADREEYFRTAEGEVVRLALAIARKVLGREAEANPLHLRGVVKAALGRVQDGSASTLRVGAGCGDRWRGIFAGEVVEDERLEAGALRLETTVGQVDLGVRAQMEEVERQLGAGRSSEGQCGAGRGSVGQGGAVRGRERQ